MFHSNEKISGHQALMLIFAAGIGNIFVVQAPPAVKDSGRDAWIAVLLAYLLAAATGLLLLDLARRFPNQTLVEYLPEVLGKIPGKLAGLAYILGWFAMSPLILREISELMRLFMPNTPMIWISLIMSSLVVYCLYKGFEVFARTTELFSPMLIVIILIALALIWINVDYNNIRPVLEKGFFPVVKALQTQYPYAMETILFMSFWFPCLNIARDARKAVLFGMPIIAVLLAVLAVSCIGFLGLGMTEMHIYPVLRLFRYIRIQDFISGLDAFFMLIWLISSFMELMVFFINRSSV